MIPRALFFPLLALFAAAVFGACASSPQAKEDAKSEAVSTSQSERKDEPKSQLEKEKRLVALLRMGRDPQSRTPQNEAEIRTLLDEVTAPAVEGLSGDEAGKKRQEALWEIIGRHDPELLAELKKGIELFRCRAMQAEGKTALKALWVNQETYRAEFDTYATDLSALAEMPPWQRYLLQVVSADKKGFVGRALGHGDMEGDILEITEKGNVIHVHNKCPMPKPPEPTGTKNKD
jgi:hypothetical protein